jgi:cell wall-associated NlpC family hydrolase
VSLAPLVLLSAAAIVAPLAHLAAQQSDLSVSPFVTFLPTTGASPLAGLALTLAGNGPLALRASGHMSLENQNTNTFTGPQALRPWGADADLMMFLTGHGARRAISPYLFAGVGVAGSDSLTLRGSHNDWSYGGGLTVPVASAIEVFGEARWRMSRYVLPTANLAPSPGHEFRFGVSFHVGGSSHGNRESLRDRRSDATFSVPARFAVTVPAPATTSATATRVLNTADDYLGVPYRKDGTSPAAGFDASGFTQYVFARQGVRLPRTAAQQAQVGLALPSDWSAVKPGDLVMFREDDQIDHVAIYAGNNRIIHSTATGGGVRYDDLGTQRGEWFVDHMVALRRVTADAGASALNVAAGLANAPTKTDGADHAPKPE